MGLALLSYAVNLFIFSMGRRAWRSTRSRCCRPVCRDPGHYADPMPQALVLTAIVIGFAMTALFLVVLLASRGMSGTDHVDGATRVTNRRCRELDWLSTLMPHLMLAPILLPMFTAALMLLLREERQRLKLGSTLRPPPSACALRWRCCSGAEQGGPSAMGVYLPGNWPAPFGIVLALDRLSAMMLLLTYAWPWPQAVLRCALAQGRGALPPAVPVPADGPVGRLLTADLFNLFVFFEIMLAASYGLLLHGSGRTRVQAGLHYIAINLAASSLFLIGVSMLYGITGTLNMADLAQAIPHVSRPTGACCMRPPASWPRLSDQGGLWPLNFWLVPAYSAASAPVAPVCAHDQGGRLRILRLWTLLFSSEAGDRPCSAASG
jgi:multicomponent K+:H+ antiporter subunit D